MAPEQLRNSEAVDRRVDIWGLGVALWETLAIKRLFKRDTNANTMYAALYDDVPPPSRFRPHVPKELDEIVLKALARDPAERWPTAREMGRALREFLGTQKRITGPAELSEWMAEVFPQGEARKAQLMELARMARVPVPSLMASKDTDATLAATEAAQDLIPPKRRSWRLLVVALLIGVAASAVAIPLALRRNERTPTVETLDIAPAGSAETPAPPSEATMASRTEAPADEAVEPTKDEPTEAPPTTKPATRAKKQSAKRRTRSKPLATTKAPVSTTPGTINLVVRGGWAEIFEDGKSLGTTPRRLTLPAGRHELVLKPSDGKPKRVVIDVRSGETKKVSVALD